VQSIFVDEIVCKGVGHNAYESSGGVLFIEDHVRVHHR
jgi:hypothetical protein